MMGFRTAALVALIVAGTGSVALLYGPLQDPATQPAGPKLSAEEIFEFHTKQDQPGNAEAGRPIFEQQCAACHRFGALGKEIGPDLSTITSRFTRKDMLESILWPSRVISDQYKSQLFQLKTGKIISGVVVRETAASVLVRTADVPDRPVSVPKAQIAERGESKVSLMPEGLLEGYSQADIANLLTFLMSPPPTVAYRDAELKFRATGSALRVPRYGVSTKIPYPTPAGSLLRADWKAIRLPSGLTTGFEAL
jgi:putative heme-binding domain-containing protein